MSDWNKLCKIIFCNICYAWWRKNHICLMRILSFSGFLGRKIRNKTNKTINKINAHTPKKASFVMNIVIWVHEQTKKWMEKRTAKKEKNKNIELIAQLKVDQSFNKNFIYALQWRQTNFQWIALMGSGAPFNWSKFQQKRVQCKKFGKFGIHTYYEIQQNMKYKKKVEKKRGKQMLILNCRQNRTPLK